MKVAAYVERELIRLTLAGLGKADLLRPGLHALTEARRQCAVTLQRLDAVAPGGQSTVTARLSDQRRLVLWVWEKGLVHSQRELGYVEDRQKSWLGDVSLTHADMDLARHLFSKDDVVRAVTAVERARRRCCARLLTSSGWLPADVKL